MAIFELLSPRLARPEMAGAMKARRWFTNFSILILSSILVRLIFPAAAVGAAAYADSHGWGISRVLGFGGLAAGIISFFVLDFAVWLEHVASHKIPLLWRIHRMHHADQGFDATTALRFHPVEIVLSMFWKAGVVVAIGAPVMSVLLFEIVLNGAAMFNHANIAIPKRADRILRRFIVTPDMHRVHHSSERAETDSNYGFNFPFWDRLFSTYRSQPRLGHENMEIGLKSYRDYSSSNLLWSLMLPLRK
jgi:sterol desaturase/sphingolipid hydroxylase (fatty acid hydroxylase superfamily)